MPRGGVRKGEIMDKNLQELLNKFKSNLLNLERSFDSSELQKKQDDALKEVLVNILKKGIYER